MRCDSLEELLIRVVTVIDAALFVTLLALSLIRTRSPVPPEPPPAPVTAGSVSGFVPAAAGADGDVERDGQVGGAGHLLADQLLERVTLALGHLEHELVVDLQQHP